MLAPGETTTVSIEAIRAVREPVWTTHRISRLRNAKRLVDIRLIIIDLGICDQLLDKIEQIGNYQSPDLIREALSWALLVKLISCFKPSEMRARINQHHVFSTTELIDYRYFEAIRNKNVAHDVNSMRILEPVALFGAAPHHRLDSINFFMVQRPLEYKEDVPKLRALLAAALNYARGQERAKTQMVADELNLMTPAARVALPNFDGSSFQINDVDKPRTRRVLNPSAVDTLARTA
jgi:hypothetical protein